MNRTIRYWKISGFIFTGIAGVFLHFLYEWSNENKLAALFSGVNESTWEHMKLLFFPALTFALAESFFSSTEREDFWSIKFKAICLGLTTIPVIFYSINGIFGKSPSWVNILIFFIADAVIYLYETKLYGKKERKSSHPAFSILLLLLIAALFFIFTFTPPKIPLTKDPITGFFGIK